MDQEFIATGSTVDEAVNTGCAQLGLSRDDVSFEVVELPQKKLFGMSPAKVRIVPNNESLNITDLLYKDIVVTEPVMEERRKPEPRPAKPQTNSARKPENRPAPASTQNIELETFTVSDKDLRELQETDLTAPALAALAYFRALTAELGAVQLNYKFFETERGVKFSIDGEDSSLVIGRRGETMDALQYLCMLVSSRTEGDYCKIMLDVAQYRGKREKTLQALALREAEKVKRTQYNQTLDPMNPYERRIVHSAIQQIEGVKSESVGSEPNRRVVISLIEGGRGNRRGRSGSGNSRSGGQGGNNRNSGNRRDSGKGGQGGYRSNQNRDNRPAPQPRPDSKQSRESKPSEGSVDLSMLYGKIDL